MEDRIWEFVIDTIKAKDIHSKKNIMNDNQLKGIVWAEVTKKLKGFE